MTLYKKISKYRLWFKQAILVWLVFFSLFLAIFLSFYLRKTVFFDKFIYQKDDKYGYNLFSGGFDPLQISKASKNIQYRLRDLHYLLTGKTNGFTDLEVDQDTFTIALVGDSNVYGQGVLEQQTTGRILEKKLSKHRKTKVYVLAEPMDDFIDNLSKFQLAEKKLDPDLTIIGLLPNDLAFNDVNRYPNKREIIESVQDKCDGQITFINWENEEALYPDIINGKSSNLCIINQLLNGIDSSYSLFYFLYYGSSDFNTKYGNIYLETNKTLIKTINSHGIKLFDPKVEFQKVSSLELHPSAITHYHYASTLYHEITTNSAWGF